MARATDRAMWHRRWFGVVLALAGSLALSSCAVGDAANTVARAAAQASCKPGELAVGKKETVTDSAKQKVLITGGECFDRINTPAAFLNLSDDDNKRVEDSFCSKLGVEPDLNKALGHGISSASTLALLPRDGDDSAPRGLCTWSENYLALRKQKGVPYWREVSVSYSVNRTRLSGEYEEEGQTLAEDSTLTFKKLSGIGAAALAYTGSRKPEAHGILAADFKGSTVLVTANNPDVTNLLPDIAKQSLALAAKVKNDPAAAKPSPTPSGATEDAPVALGTLRQIGDYSVVVKSFTPLPDGSEEAEWTVTYTGETQGDTGFINLWFMTSEGALGDQGCGGVKPQTQSLEPNQAVDRQSCAPLNGNTFSNKVFVFTANQPENFWSQN